MKLPEKWKAAAVALEMELKRTRAELRQVQDRLLTTQRHVCSAALNYQMAKIELGRNFLGGDHQAKIDECIDLKNYMEGIRDQRLAAAEHRGNGSVVQDAEQVTS